MNLDLPYATKVFRTKLPRKLKKHNKKIGKLVFTAVVQIPVFAEYINVNIGFTK